MQQSSKFGGIAFIFGNILFLINKLNEMSRLFFGYRMPDAISGHNILLVAIGQIALIIGYITFLKRYLEHTRGFGKVALWLFAIGGISLALGHTAFTPLTTLEFMFIFVLLGLALMLIGLIWFGIINLYQAILRPWRWLPLTTGVMGFIGFFLFSGDEITATFLFFRTLFALGLVGLGFGLLLAKPIKRFDTLKMQEHSRIR